MKNILLLIVTFVTLLASPKVNYGQAPDLGRASSFALFTASGAVANNGATKIRGDIGTHVGAYTGSPTIIGSAYIADSVSAKAAIAVDSAYARLFALTCDSTIGTTLGSGQTLKPYIYCLGAASTLTGTLILDAKGDPNAIFIFKIDGAFSTSTFAKISLINGASLCNVYWQINGAFELGDNSVFAGTVVNSGAITLLSGATLVGRALSTAGQIELHANNISIGVIPNTNIIANKSLTRCIGDTVTLTARITNGLDPITYKWNNGGLTDSTIMVHPINNITYIASVTSLNGCKAGVDSAVIIVNKPANITTQPTNQAGCIGGSESFSVSATGTGLTYQWRKGNTNISNGLTISGATSASLTINPTISSDAATNYNVIVYSACGNDTSNNTSLTINVAAAITTQPTNQTGCAGGSESFSVSATGTGLTYQWRKGSTSLSNGGSISGATSATLTINPTATTDAANNYNVIVYGTCGNDTSNNTSLTINVAAAITTQPTNQTGCAGGSESFSVSATGTGLTYQWRKGSTSLSNGGSISGATSSTLTINPTATSDAANNYNVIVYGTCGNDTSNNVSLTINVAAKITTQPTNQAGCEGGSESFSVSATGTGLTYQWRKGNTNLSNGGSISGATSASLTINPTATSDAATDYNVIVFGTCGNDTSNNVSLTINVAAKITTQPTNQVGCEGGSESFSVSATGSGLTYQWRKGSTNLSNGGSISGATSTSLTINPTATSDAATDYNVIVFGACGNDTSNNVSLTINVAAKITTQPTNQAGCEGGSESFSVSATGTGLTYQWRKGNTNLSNGGTISGATSASLTINPTATSDAATDYNVIVYGTCGNDTSNNVSLTINVAAKITTQPTNQAGCEGGSESFSVSATGTGLTYQWRKGNTNLSNGGSISGATSTSLTINPTATSDAGNNYNVIVFSACGNDTSNNVSLTINVAAVVDSITPSQTICLGNAVTYKVYATGTGMTYQWRRGSTYIFNGGRISGANTNTLNLSSTSLTDESNDYNVIVYSACGNDTSSDVSLTINTAPIIDSITPNQTVCLGDSVSIKVYASGSGLTYQWRKGTTKLVNGGNVSGVNTSTLTFNPIAVADENENYNVVIIGDCYPGTTSSNIYIHVNTPPVITTQPTKQSGCIGGAETFYVIATGTNLTYQWRKGNVNLTNGGNISGVTTPFLTINPLDAADTSSYYNVIVTGVCAPTDTSKNAALEFCNETGIALSSDENVNQASIYPNPFTSSTTISIANYTTTNTLVLKIYNLIGEEVMSTKINNQTTLLDTEHMTVGMYIFTIISNNTVVQTGKIVSQK